MEVNYFGLIGVTRGFAPVIVCNGGGSVANLLSVVSLASMPPAGGYSASKAAAWSATLSLRSDLAKQNIRVFAVFPSPIDIKMSKGFEFAKAPAIDVADEVLAGITADTDDNFPHPLSKQVCAASNGNHKAVEKQFSSM